MRKAALGAVLAFLLLAGAAALAPRPAPLPAAISAPLQDEKPVPLDDSFWTGTVTVEESEKAWSEGWACDGFRESQRTRKTTYVLDRVERYGDVDEWASERGASFNLSGSRSELSVCRPDGNYKGMRQRLSETTEGSGTAEVALSALSRDEKKKPDRMSITLSAVTDDEKVTIKRHWEKTTEDGTKTWNDESLGSAGIVSFEVPYDPDDAVLSGTKTDRRSYKGEPNPSYWSGEVLRTYHYELRRSRPTDLEAVIIPLGDYDSWWPKAGKDERRAGPKPLAVKVRLQKKGAPGKPGPKKAKFEFELVDTSREKGICLNWPEKGVESYDLAIEQSLNDELRVEADEGGEKGQKARTKASDLNEARVTVSCFDYGAFARLRVTAILDEGKPTETRIPACLESNRSKYALTIPRDGNNNKIADDWEDFNGVESGLAAEDAETDPEGDGNAGDGLTLYEEYRGFMENGKHVCGEPLKKDLFICNTIGEIVAPGLELFRSITGLKVHDKLKEKELGTSRVVNRHHSKMPHAVDQHGLKLVKGSSRNTSRAVWRDDGPKVIGTPKRYKHVEISTGLLGRMTASFELDSTVAHELLHCCCVKHHGNSDLRDRTIRSKPGPGGAFAVYLYNQDKNGRPQGAGVLINLFEEDGDRLAPVDASEPIYRQGFSVYVGKKQGEHSGDVGCVMRYDVAECYVSSAGQYVLFDDNEVVGGSVCSQTAGTGVNAAGRKPEPRYGDANASDQRGNCGKLICVNDKYH
jgi:hypothetical protein